MAYLALVLMLSSVFFHFYPDIHLVSLFVVLNNNNCNNTCFHVSFQHDIFVYTYKKKGWFLLSSNCTQSRCYLVCTCCIFAQYVTNACQRQKKLQQDNHQRRIVYLVIPAVSGTIGHAHVITEDGARVIAWGFDLLQFTTLSS